MSYNQCQDTSCEHFGGLPICKAASENVKICNKYIHPQDRMERIQNKLRKISIDLDFQKIHFPKSLIMAMTSEIGELAHICRWKTEAEILMMKGEQLQKIKEEIADIMICALNFAQVMNLDPCEIIKEKIKLNERKYVPEAAPTITEQSKIYTDNNDGTITDFATGLMWQRSGATRWMEYDAAKSYIEDLNKNKFSGHTDWRLPTLAELKNLLESEKQSNGLYIDPIFEKKQEWCWSSELHPGGGVWGVDFNDGDVYWDSVAYYVRAVRDGNATENQNKHDKSGYELVRIPRGEFLMGSPEFEEGRYDDEGPQHKVQVPEFYMGRYPVTNEEYERFLAENEDMKEPKCWSDRNFNQPHQPVVGVSWDDAKKYAEWSAGLMLPTEVQWEYACRAGTTTRYHTGDSEEDLERAGWYIKNSGGRLHMVGEKEPNKFGLYDMHGNIWEWMEDDWHDNYTNAPDDGRAWVNESRGQNRVCRGGSWYSSNTRHCRSAFRNRYAPGRRYSNFGFRLVCRLPLPAKGY